MQNGTPLFALQELAGWETERMAWRYAHLAADHLAAYDGRGRLLTFVSQGLEHRLEQVTRALCTGSFPGELLKAEAPSPRQFP